MNTFKSRIKNITERAIVILLSFLMVISTVPFYMYETAEAANRPSGYSYEKNKCINRLFHNISGFDKYGVCTSCGDWNKSKTNWSIWTQTTTLPVKTGHYILQNDIKLSTKCSITTEATIYIDLNGYSINANGKGVFYLAGEDNIRLYIYNSSSGTKSKIYNTRASAIEVFQENAYAEINDGVSIESCKSTLGGAIGINNGGTFSMYGGTIDNCTASDRGGAVCIYYLTGTFNMYGGTISNCVATNDGGAIYAIAGTFNMYGGEITKNESTNANGGGIRATYATSSGYIANINMSGGTISNNKAKGYGGGIAVSKGAANITNGTISGNTAIGKGGGICVNTYPASLTLTGADISNNTSNSDETAYYYKGGGGVFFDGNSGMKLTINGGTKIHDNTATYGGGGGAFIFCSGVNSSPTVEISGASVYNNNAFRPGGGLYLSFPNGTYKNLKVYNNRVSNGEGGGLKVNNSYNLKLQNCCTRDNLVTKSGKTYYDNINLGSTVSGNLELVSGCYQEKEPYEYEGRDGETAKDFEYGHKMYQNVKISSTKANYEADLSIAKDGSEIVQLGSEEWNKTLPSINIPEKYGYDFLGYYDAEGRQYYTDAGQPVRKCDCIGITCRLYAKWHTKGVFLENQEKTIFRPVGNTDIPITKAIKGTGKYTYTKTSETSFGENSNYFTVIDSVDNPVLRAENATPVGTYTIGLKVHDNDTGLDSEAIYTVNVTKYAPEITVKKGLSGDNMTLSYPESKVIEVSSSGYLEANSSDLEVVTPTVDHTNNKVTITSGTKAGTAQIQLVSVEDDTYMKGTKIIEVTVQNGKIVLSSDSVVNEYDGKAHSVRLSTNAPNSLIRYGKSSDDGMVFTTNLVEAGKFYSLSDIELTDIGTQDIYYRVSCPGYDDVEGKLTLEVEDTIAPEISAEVTNDVSDVQYVSLFAEDVNKVDKYYFGTDVIGEQYFDWSENLTKTIQLNGVDSATYYYKVVDKAGNYSEVMEFTFYKTDLIVNNGRAKDGKYKYLYDGIITLSGDSFKMPAIEGNTGYDDSTTWNNKYITLETGETYTPDKPRQFSATCMPSKLSFEGSSKTIKTSSSKQEVLSVKSPKFGSGNYQYSKVSETKDNNKVTETKYFEVTSTGNISVVPDVPYGKYDIVVKAFDTTTGASTEATYTVNVLRKEGTISIDKSNLSLNYPETGSIVVKANSGQISVTSDAPEIATASYDEAKKTITVYSGNSVSNSSDCKATITVTAGETDICSAESVTCSVLVSASDIKLSVISCNAMYDGKSHNNAKVKSDVAGVTISYKADNGENYEFVIDEANQYYELSAASRTDLGRATISITADKLGYNTAHTETYIDIYDAINPTASIVSCTNSFATTQTVELSGNDDYAISKYYFGNKVPTTDPSTDWSGSVQEEASIGEENFTTYYFQTMDVYGNKSEIATITLHKVVINVVGGKAVVYGSASDAPSYVLIRDGDSFTLPTITESTGFYDTNAWYEDDKKVGVEGEAYKVNSSAKLVATCEEASEDLVYDNNGYGTTPATQKMRYTQEVHAAAPIIDAEDMLFVSWNTDPDGKGTEYKARAKVKAKDTYAPEGGLKLYAQFVSGKVDFSPKEYTITSDISSQSVNIVEASGGSGSFEYSVYSQPVGNYFEVQGKKLIASADVPAGEYEVYVLTRDTEYEVEKRAKYSITVLRRNGEIEIDKSNLSLTYPEDGTVTVKAHSGEIEAKASDDGIVSLECDKKTGEIKVTALPIKTEVATTTVVVKSKQTDSQNEISTSFDVTVNQGKFEITPISCNSEVDGKDHFASLSSDLQGVEVRYGLDEKLPYSITFDGVNTVDLSAVTLSQIGDVKVQYTASYPGYTSVSGFVDIHIGDTTAPTTSMVCDTNNKVSAKQSVSVSATDHDIIEKYYFGKLENPQNSDFEAIQKASSTFNENFDVETDGTYFFYAKDKAGNISDKCSLTFYMTELEVKFGSVVATKILTCSGDSFLLPEVTPNTGYILVEDWSNGIKTGGTYTPTASSKLTISCEENHGVLTYITNHGIAPDKVSMRFNDEIYAADAISADGYVFEYWNTKEDGTGERFESGRKIKNAQEDGYDLELYAYWSVAELSFSGSTYELDCSDDSQVVTSLKAGNGTGTYKYEIASGETEYFSLDEDVLSVKGMTPSGNHSVVVKAIDKESNAEKEATFTVKLAKIENTFTLKNNELSLTYPESGKITVDKNISGGEISATVDNSKIASVEVNDGEVVVTSGTTSGDAKVYVKSSATAMYKEATVEVAVQVKANTFEITPIPCNVDFDGAGHTAQVKASLEGVTLHYGVNDLSNLVTVGTEPVELSNVKFTESNTYVINYMAEKAGYEDVVGTVTVTIVDLESPTIAISAENKVATTQKVKLSAHDSSNVVKYYWGEKEDFLDTDLITLENGGEIDFSAIVDVNKEGKYFFYAEDSKGNKSEESVTFVITQFTVTEGSSNPAYTINEIDSSFTIPEILANEGYVAPRRWSGNVNPGDTYKATSNYELFAECTEKVATLKYETVRGTLPVDKVEMRLTTETKVADGISDGSGLKGWSFVEWNTKKDGKGNGYQPGDIINNVGQTPNDTTLYAIWKADDIEFDFGIPDDYVMELEGDYVATNPIQLPEAKGGSGEFEYSIANQPAGDYFSIELYVEVYLLKINSSIPAGSYSVRIQALDKNTGLAAYQTIRFKIKKLGNYVSIDNNYFSITFGEEIAIEVTENLAGSDIVVTSDNDDIIDYTVEDNSIINVEAKDIGDVVLTVESVATSKYSSAKTEAYIEIGEGELDIQVPNIVKLIDGKAYCTSARSAGTDGVRLEYGDTEDCESGVIRNLGSEEVQMPKVSRSEKGTTTVYYIASKTGYHDATGSAKITITDDVKPTATISDVTDNLKDEQSLTLYASDNSRISAYYFGTNPKPEKSDFTVLSQAVNNFTKTLDVKEAGKYYFIAQDKGGENSEAVSIEFFKTTFSVKNGKTDISSVLTESGKSFKLPNIIPDDDYVAPLKWSYKSASIDTGKLAPTATYTPIQNVDLIAECTKIERKLSVSHKSTSLKISSDLAVNFYFNIPEEIRGGVMAFTIDHNGGTQEIISSDSTDNGEMYACEINVNQICDGISWTYTYDGKTYESEEPYTFMKYLDTVTTKEDYKGTALCDFANKMKAYGYYAQRYLSKINGFVIGTDHEEIIEPIEKPTVADLSEYKTEITGSSEYISSADPVYLSLSLDSNVSLLVYIPLVDGCELTDENLPDITVDGVKVDTDNVWIEEGYICVKVPEIRLASLTNKINIAMGDYKIETTAMAYVNLLTKDSSDNSVYSNNLGYSLYELCMSAQKYAQEK